MVRRISARAEEPRDSLNQNLHRGAHLRASGGTNDVHNRFEPMQGASPRERRNHVRFCHGPVRGGRISARAEEPHKAHAAAGAMMAHLRASGGTWVAVGLWTRRKGASPRERRNRVQSTSSVRSSRRISARAEEPMLAALMRPLQEAHLRASGGTRCTVSHAATALGASPRERRNPVRTTS